MQTLWTRVAQVRGSCRCPQCLSAANGVSRRATATATRRMPKYLTSSTLWYSGIFAAAATFDAGIKKQRKEQWDRAIADVKQDLEQSADTAKQQGLDMPEAAQANFEDAKVRFNGTKILPAGNGAFQYTMAEQAPTKDAEAQYKPFTTLPDEESMFQYLEQRPKTRPRWPSNTGAPLRETQLPPESIYAHPKRKHKLENTPLGAKKVAEIQVSIELLLLELFLHLQKRNWSVEAARAVPEEFSRLILRSQSELLSDLDSKHRTYSQVKASDPKSFDHQPREYDQFHLCHFRQDSLREANHAVSDLNLSLLELFKQQADNQISTPALLGKLAYNISTCSGPPNLKTFNTLLLGLSAMDDSYSVNRVIKSIGRAHMRPNEVTLATILKHYTKRNRPYIFVKWVERMRGKHGGLCLARADMTTTATGCGSMRLLPHPENPEKIIQLPYATPFVFGPLIAGVIKFAGFETALDICKNMGLEGWGLCMSGLTPLLQSCAERADWSSGVAIWDQIQALKSFSRRKEGSAWMSERIKLDTFAAMLRLCCRCDRKDYFERIWDMAVKAYADSTDKLAKLVKGEAVQELDAGLNPDERDTAEIRRSLAKVTRTRSMAGNSKQLDISTESEIPEKADRPHVKQVQAARGLQDEIRQIPVVESAISEDIPEPGQFRNGRDVALGIQRPDLRLWKPELLEEQLLGSLAPDDELDAYELHERPMRLPAGTQHEL